jgi:DNA-3-methyladenine glycosylase II
MAFTNIAAHNVEMICHPRPPFDLNLTLRFVLSPPSLRNGRSHAALLDYWVEGEYRRAARIGHHLVLYGVKEERRGAKRLLSVRILSGPRDKDTQSAVITAIERQFATALDLAPFYRLAESDPALARIATHFRGMRIPQAASVFECLVSAILEQQVNLAFAHQVKKALVEALGEKVAYEGRTYNAFPEPSALAPTTPRQLRKLQISGPKARYIIGLSRFVTDGRADLEQLRTLPPPAARSQLLQHKGVGPWTAEYVGLRALGHLDCLPAADVGLQKAIQHLYGLRKQPSPERVKQFGRRWGAWRSYATFYLWLTYWESPAWRNQLRKEILDTRLGARS